MSNNINIDMAQNTSFSFAVLRKQLYFSTKQLLLEPHFSRYRHIKSNYNSGSKHPSHRTRQTQQTGRYTCKVVPTCKNKTLPNFPLLCFKRFQVRFWEQTTSRGEYFSLGWSPSTDINTTTGANTGLYTRNVMLSNDKTHFRPTFPKSPFQAPSSSKTQIQSAQQNLFIAYPVCDTSLLLPSSSSQILLFIMRKREKIKYAEDMLVLLPFAKLNPYSKVTVYWHGMRRRVVSRTDRCQRLGGTCCIQLPGRRLNFYSEN